MLVAAAALMFLLGLAHSVLGERYLLIRLFRRPDLPKLLGGTAFTTQTLRFAWHLTTVIAWGLAAVVLQVGDLPDADGRRIATTLAVTLGLSGLLPLIFTRGRHLSWVVLFASGGLLLAWSLR
ncbi:hypothetical protein SAMN05428982_0976 [Pseudoxanthomonas sp. CF385]|uniref:hypothetical protein n=1 Tax=Pseudoxanthomonas sp. CF385 TaxID=1881042 RepID=UPI0008827857|nr:hypothetical protein [Pseudoxanthomonas sp. CF385]SDQ40246.1 hypothetical protein SAMN05428982_0976 [Pseudoxanthomonas sp. CF385]